MATKIEKIKIIFYILIQFLKNRKKRLSYSNAKGKRVVIVFQQIFGDALLLSSTFNAYTKLFPEDDGYKVTLLCLPSVNKFLEETVDIPKSIEIKTVDFKKILNDFKMFKKTVNNCNSNYDIAIVPGSSVSAEILMTAASIPTKIGLVQHKVRKWPPYLSVIQKMAYSEVKRPPKEMMVLQRHSFFINSLGLKGFKSSLPVLKKIEWNGIEHNYAYCVIAPGASKAEKCWPIERFSELSNFIIQEYDFDVVICGGKDEKHYADELIRLSQNDRIHDFTGKTTFAEWSAIVQNAKLVVGNDSATMHLAAASSKKSVCVAGLYDKGHFFPYALDVLREGERLPRTVLVDMPCEYCRTIGYYSGYGNEKCKKMIQSGKCALCIDAISVDMVKQAIKEIM